MLELVCPLCRTTVESDDRGVRCPSCHRHYPRVAGIVDLRVAGDRYLSLEDDREKAQALAATDGGFEETLRGYWARTPEVPRHLADRYVARALEGVRRAEVHLDRAGVAGGSLLDVGCGTGGLLVAAAVRGAAPVGVDVALRWLVVAARLLLESGVEAELVAADGALLPFRHGSFSTVTSIEVLEHAADQRGLLHGCLGAVAPGGRAYAVTANRFSLAPEPTVGLWGVGWLPRGLAVPYVERRRNTRYRHFRPLSVGALDALLGPRTEGRVRAAILPPPGSGSGPLRHVVGRWYDSLAGRRSGALLRHVAPYLEVTTGDGAASVARRPACS